MLRRAPAPCPGSDEEAAQAAEGEDMIWDDERQNQDAHDCLSLAIPMIVCFVLAAIFCVLGL
jgi:hypothetical protein